MTEEKTIEEKLAEVAAQPKSYEVDGEKITNHSLAELAEADKYLGRKRAGRRMWGSVQLAKISTEGPER